MLFIAVFLLSSCILTSKNIYISSISHSHQFSFFDFVVTHSENRLKYNLLTSPQPPTLIIHLMYFYQLQPNNSPHTMAEKTQFILNEFTLTAKHSRPRSILYHIPKAGRQSIAWPRKVVGQKSGIPCETRRPFKDLFIMCMRNFLQAT